MLEKQIERRLVELCKRHGALCIKLMGYKGIPDRLILTKTGKVMFIELKRPDVNKMRVEQNLWQQKLRNMNFDARMINSYEQVDNLESFLG